MDVNSDLLPVGIRQILAGLEFPAHRWQIIAQAQYYGAGADFLLALDRLPARIYPSLEEVISYLVGRHDQSASPRDRQPARRGPWPPGAVAAPRRPGVRASRPQPTPPAPVPVG
jgi:Protein of unknown function (DUF2795)